MLHLDWYVIVFFILLCHDLVFLKIIWWKIDRRNWWHGHWRNTMRSVDHATSYSLLMGVVASFLWGFRIFGHVLEIEEAAMSISMCLRLHHLQSLLILVSLSMHWTRPYHHLLILVMPLTLHILLVLHVLKLVKLMLLLRHHLPMLVEVKMLLVDHVSSSLSLMLVIVDKVRLGFDDKVFFLVFRLERKSERVYVCSALDVKAWVVHHILLVAGTILMGCLRATLFGQAGQVWVVIIIITLMMTANFQTRPRR